ncbi:DUF1127 domain-containing protein [Azospirillum sp.]|uniref:DUF1127 domain-containing protein n=1 Tax=Azospirillum sp. TaxID=34012 RepID=UPI002D48C9E9|nr:DUF1127 domain-containing protein [Azospirillum sp.]HYD70688.1 DUF1127 domain-containing protein [Azospirillum sp.]
MATALHSAHTGRGSFGFALSHTIEHLFDTLSVWHQRMVTRHELAQLDERMLRDIGISRLDVEGEVSKPFWRA